jgi:predicted MPP superfamily phosphohydrolase
MFHTIITIAYILPNIYLFFRIGKNFINKGYRIHYSLVYLILASIYPVSNSFSEREADEFISILIVVGNYILTFYLYLFLFVLSFDLFRVVNYLIKVVPSDVIRSTRFKKILLSIILFLSITVVVIGIINFNTIRISGYQIEIPRKSSKISHLRIAFVADFHLQKGTNVHFVERFVKKIETIQPDLMLYGGDIVEGNRGDADMEKFEDMLRKINTKYGVFTVLGNHEFYSGQDKGSFLRKSGMTILTDSIVVIDNSISLAGRYDSHFNARKTIAELMQSVSDTLPVILLDHRPTEIGQVSKTRVDLQLSGHTHNGQLFPINLIIKGIYQLSWGHKKIGNTHFFVTSGIRLWGPPVRTTGKSEIMVIDITFAGE